MSDVLLVIKVGAFDFVHCAVGAGAEGANELVFVEVGVVMFDVGEGGGDGLGDNGKGRGEGLEEGGCAVEGEVPEGGEGLLLDHHGGGLD